MTFLWTPETGATTVDSFESQGNWTWDVVTETDENPDRAVDGVQMLKSPSGDFNGDSVQEPNGENFGIGSTSRVYFWIDDSCVIRITWGLDDANGDGYRIELSTSSGSLDLERIDGDSPTDINTTTISSVNSNRWNYADITWDDGSLGGSNGEHTVEFFDATDDSSYGSISGVDTTYSGAGYDGMGFYTSGLTGNGFFDYWHKDSLETPPVGPRFIDSFDDQDISPYSGDTGQFSYVTAPIQQGSHALRGDAGTFGSRIFSTSLDYLVEYPTKFGGWVRADNTGSAIGIIYGAADLNNLYQAELDTANSVVTHRKVDGGSFQNALGDGSGFSFSVDTWYWLQAYWDDGTLLSSGSDYHKVEIYDDRPRNGGTLLDSVEGTDSSISNTNTGTGISSLSNNSGENTYIDAVQLL